MPNTSRLTRDPVLIKDEMLMTAGGVHLFRLIEQPGLGRAAEPIKTMIAAAYSSYANHCGPHAIECAKGDFLGEVLAALRGLMDDLHVYHDETGKGESVVSRESFNAALAALTMVQRPPSQPTGTENRTVAVLDRIFDELTDYLVDECPDEMNWEDFAPEVDQLRTGVSDLLETLRD